MGASFTNYHIRKGKKNRDAFTDKLRAFIGKTADLVPCGHGDSGESGSVTVYFPENGEWISFFSDLLEPREETLTALSKTFGADVLCAVCTDSDCVTLDLVNSRKKLAARVNAGRADDYGLEPKTDLSGWEGAVSDIEKFRADIAENHVFEEDFLNTLNDTLRLPPEQARIDEHSADRLDESRVIRLYFRTTDVTDEPVKLVIQYFSLMPCRFDSPVNIVCAYNDGRASKGIEVYFTGDYVENDEITFKDVQLETHPKGEWKRIPIELKKVQLQGGKYAYYWKDENFIIPASPNRSLPFGKLEKERDDRSFLVRFTPQGNRRKALDITVWLIPLENSDGGCCWYVWKGYRSKRDYMKKEAADYNEFLLSVDKNGSEEGLMNPNDYDVD